MCNSLWLRFDLSLRLKRTLKSGIEAHSFLTIWKLKRALQLSEEHVFPSEMCRCSPPPSSSSLPLSSLPFTPLISFIFHSLEPFLLFFFFFPLTGSQFMVDDSREVWAGPVLYSFSLQSTSPPESWQDERSVFFFSSFFFPPLIVRSSAHHFTALSTLSTSPASPSIWIIVLWIFTPPPLDPPSLFFLPLC